MHRNVLVIVILLASLLSFSCDVKPTSPDYTRPKHKKTTRTKSKKKKKAFMNPNRPGGHRKHPLKFAISPGKVGTKNERPYGVWQKFGRDLRLLQDPAPNEGTPPPKNEGKLLFEDDFERDTLGPNWRIGGGHYYISKSKHCQRDGKPNRCLASDEAYNENVFLTKPLPKNVRIEFDTKSTSRRLDIKCSLFDDGKEHESGYVVLMGGWYNSLDLIARGREHDFESVCRSKTPWEEGGRWKPGKWYHWTIIRKDGKLYWYVDDKLYLVYDDPEPLYGEKNKYFSFSNWKSHVYFDNLKIYDLGENDTSR